MKKPSEEKPDWQEQRNRIIGLGESSLRKSYYPELQQKMAELQKTNEELHAAYEQLSSSEEELRENYEELSTKEQELRENEEKYRNLIENSFDGIVIHRDTKIVFLNQTALRLFGISDIRDYIGRSIFTFIHPDYQTVVAERADSGRTDVQQPLAEKFVRASGEIFDVEVVAVPITWEGKMAVQVAFRDITAQKAAEAALRESEQRYRTLVETTDTGFVIVDLGGRVIDANQKYVQLSGHREISEIHGRNVIEWTAQHDLERNRDAVAHCVKDGFIRNFEIDYVTPSGSFTPIEINATVVRFKDTQRILTLCRDITERRKAEQALKDSEQFYRAIFDTTGSASVIIEKDTTLIHVNEGFARLSGYTVQELEGMHRWTEFVVPEDLTRMRKYHDDRRKDPGSAPLVYEFRFVDRCGTLKYCISNVATIPGTTRSIASLVDITDRVVAEHALEEKNRELDSAYQDLSQKEEELRQNYEELIARERELRESEHRNATLLHAIPDMMFVISRDGVYRDFSVPDTSILAIPANQIIGKNIRGSGFGDESTEIMMHHIGLALETGALQQFEYELDLPRGKCQYESRLVALNEDEVLGIVRDITERKHSEKALREISHELQQILKSMINAFVIFESVFDENGNYVSFRFGYFNDSFARMANVNLEDVQGMDVFTVWPTTEKSWLEVYREVALTGEPRTFEMYHDPTKGFYHCNAYRPQDNPDRICVIFEDITERKRAEQALRSAKTHLEAIYEGSPDLIYVHGADGRIIDVNANVLNVFGMSRDEVITAQPHEMSGEGYTSEMARGYMQAALTEGKVDFEWVCKKKNGEEFPLEMRLRRLEMVNEDGTLEPRILAIGRDITERRMAEQALAQGRKKLGLLNTIIFQDIQSTIFALSAYLQLASNTPDTEKIKSFAEKQNVLIQKIVSSLEFAKNYQDMGIHPPRWQNVTRVFLYALSHVDTLKISRNVDVGTLEVYADMLLEKALFNMLENALIHGERVTEISLTCEEQDGNLVLVLQDNGVGITTSEKKKIFERGYGKHAGLGLFLVREILSITGMTIRECGEEGCGARFEILIPKGVGRFPGTFP